MRGLLLVLAGVGCLSPPPEDVFKTGSFRGKMDEIRDRLARAGLVAPALPGGEDAADPSFATFYAMADRQEREAMRAALFVRRVWEANREPLRLAWLRREAAGRARAVAAVAPHAPARRRGGGGRGLEEGGAAALVPEINVAALAARRAGLPRLLDARARDHGAVVAGDVAAVEHLAERLGGTPRALAFARSCLVTRFLLGCLAEAADALAPAPPARLERAALFWDDLGLPLGPALLGLVLGAAAVAAAATRGAAPSPGGAAARRPRGRRRPRRGAPDRAASPAADDRRDVERRHPPERGHRDARDELGGAPPAAADAPLWAGVERHRDALEARAQDLFLCPIDQTIMVDPVVLEETGNTFDRRPLEAWLARRRVDPQTSEPLAREPRLVANRALARRIRAWCEAEAAALDAPAVVHVFVDASNVLVDAPAELSPADVRAETDRRAGTSRPNFGTLEHIEVDSADFWTGRLLSSSSRSRIEELASKLSRTLNEVGLKI